MFTQIRQNHMESNRYSQLGITPVPKYCDMSRQKLKKTISAKIIPVLSAAYQRYLRETNKYNFKNSLILIPIAIGAVKTITDISANSKKPICPSKPNSDQSYNHFT